MPEHSTDRAGGCSCGALRYRMLGAPLFVHCCHCTWCQRETGSAFAVNALIEADRVVLDAGAFELVATPSESGQGQRIARCPACRVAVWSHYAFGRIGDLVRFVRVGTLDAPGTVPPDVHIFTRSKLAWVQIPDDHTAVPEYYRAGELWPATSLARRAALVDASG